MIEKESSNSNTFPNTESDKRPVKSEDRVKMRVKIPLAAVELEIPAETKLGLVAAIFIGVLSLLLLLLIAHPVLSSF